MDNSSIFSPATGLDSIDAGGGKGADPGVSSIHPEYNLQERGAQAPGMKAQEAIAGVGPTAGAVEFAQLADIPVTGANGADDPMVGGLGNPPRP